MTRSIITPFLGVALVAGMLGPAAAADNPPTTPEAVLRAKGLKRSGETLVLGTEVEVQRATNAARAASRAVASIVERKRQFDQRARDGKAFLNELVQQRVVLNRQLGQAETVQQNNRLVAMLNEINDRIGLVQKEIGDPEADQAAGTRVAMQRETYIEAILKLRLVVDQTKEQYAILAKDDDVKNALAALSKGRPRPYRLGPSSAFLNNVKLLESAEKTVLTESVTLRKEGGIYWLDVTFNGKITKPMAFDTGASSVVLPYAMAKEIGLTPGADAPTVKTHVADGSVAEAKQVIAPSLRVGKFTVKDVECLVMPANKTEVPPLLGQSFHRHFTYKFTPEARTLVLTKVETETPKEPVGTAKGKGAGKGKR